MQMMTSGGVHGISRLKYIQEEGRMSKLYIVGILSATISQYVSYEELILMSLIFTLLGMQIGLLLWEGRMRYNERMHSKSV